MTTSAGTKPGGFCFRCSAPDPRHDAGREPASVYTPWPMLAPRHGLEYARANPLIRAVYAPSDLRRLIPLRVERKRDPRPVSEATEGDLAAFRDWLVLTHEFGHLFYLEWTPAKELARIYLAFCYDVIVDLMTADRLSDRQAIGAWRTILMWTQHLAQIEESVAFVEELVATAIAFTTMEMHTQPGGLWAGFGEVLERTKREFLTAEEELFPGFGQTLARFESLYHLMYGNTEFVAFMVPLLQPMKVDDAGSGGPPRALDARAHLDTILALVNGCETAATAAAQLRELEQDAVTGWRMTIGLQIASGRDETGLDGDRPVPRAELARQLWRVGRGDFTAGLVDEAMAEASHSVEGFRAHIATGGGRLGQGNLVLFQPCTHRRRRVIDVGWWDEDDAGPADLTQDHRELVVLEGLREQLLSGQGIVCPKNPARVSRCRCSLAWRKALLRVAWLAQAGAFGPGEWSPLPCRRR